MSGLLGGGIGGGQALAVLVNADEAVADKGVFSGKTIPVSTKTAVVAPPAA